MKKRLASEQGPCWEAFTRSKKRLQIPWRQFSSASLCASNSLETLQRLLDDKPGPMEIAVRANIQGPQLMRPSKRWALPQYHSSFPSKSSEHKSFAHKDPSFSRTVSHIGKPFLESWRCPSACLQLSSQCPTCPPKPCIKS